MLTTSPNKITPIQHSFFLFSKSQLWELSCLCLPLMLSALSGTLMFFIDRIVLAKYSTQSMIAATTAYHIYFIFQFGITSIAMMAEVFVGQFNGAKQWEQVSKPVWQMIWFSLLSIFIMVPIGLWGGQWLIPAEQAQEGIPYFKWIMIFGPSFPLGAALTAFFIGRKKVKVVTLSVILGSLLNLILAFAFVFGIPDLLDPMGTKGAAIATGVAELSVALGLFLLFMKSKYRKKYLSHRWAFSKDLFWKCITIGFPNSIGHIGAAAAWAFIMYLLAGISTEHVMVMTIALSIWKLFSFITDGLQKGVTALAANSLGAKRKDDIPKIMMAGLQLQFLLALVLAVPLVIMPEILVEFFIPTDIESTDISRLRELVEISCRWLWIAYVFDGMAWVIDGILTAAGDTRFIMFMNAIGTWLFCVLPIYWCVIERGGSSVVMLQLIAAFCLVLFSSYYFRYRSRKWQSSLLIRY